MLIEIISAYAMMAANTPTNGQLMRELRTEQAAFDMADTDKDGRISDFEYAAYKRARRNGADIPVRGRLNSSVDHNLDGALVPCEMYEEARCPAVRRRPQTVAQKECFRTDGYYKVDDRNGVVYCPDY